MSNDQVVISARNVWKLFGKDPRGYLARMPEGHSFADIRADGYIAGVSNVSIEVKRGEMLVIMGLSGSGKSTLVRCFSRLHDVTGGTIEVEGQNIMALGEKELIELRRSKMGMVFQSFGLLPHRTVLENVAFPLEMRGQERHTRRDRALEMIDDPIGAPIKNPAIIPRPQMTPVVLWFLHMPNDKVLQLVEDATRAVVEQEFAAMMRYGL